MDGAVLQSELVLREPLALPVQELRVRRGFAGCCGQRPVLARQVQPERQARRAGRFGLLFARRRRQASVQAATAGNTINLRIYSLHR